MHAEPFGCYRPRPEAAESFASPPYDVFDDALARDYLSHNPTAFLAIDRADATFEAGHDPYNEDVYERARSLLRERITDGTLIQDPTRCFYLYRIRKSGHEQTGIVGAFATDDYTNGIIKRHELTRPDKEADRVRHIATTGCETGPVFLFSRDNGALAAIVEVTRTNSPIIYDFYDDKDVRHTVWRVSRPAAVESIRMLLDLVPSAYIADGHHRAAASVRVSRQMRSQAGKDASTEMGLDGQGAYNFILGVIFPASQLTILPYNRVVADAAGLAERDLVSWLKRAGFRVGSRKDKPIQPTERHRIGMYAFGAWRELVYVGALPKDSVGRLDASLLQDKVLGPILGVNDPRSDPRISFAGGTMTPRDLMAMAGERGVAFTLVATTVGDLMNVADEGLLMPPKSTWFEPKLMSGLFIMRVKGEEPATASQRAKELDEMGRPLTIGATSESQGSEAPSKTDPS